LYYKQKEMSVLTMNVRKK